MSQKHVSNVAAIHFNARPYQCENVLRPFKKDRLTVHERLRSQWRLAPEAAGIIKKKYPVQSFETVWWIKKGVEQRNKELIVHLRTYVVRVLAPFPHLTAGKLDVLRTFYNVHINGNKWPIFFIYYWTWTHGTDIQHLCECSYNHIISFPLKVKILEYEFPIPFIQFWITIFLYIFKKKKK